MKPARLRQRGAPRTAAEELALCQRYFAKSYSPEVAPGNGQPGVGLGGVALLSNLIGSQRITLPVPMRAAPSLSFFAPRVGTPSEGQWAFYVAGAWTASSSIYATGVTTAGFGAEMIVSGASAGAAYMRFGSLTASAEL